MLDPIGIKVYGKEYSMAKTYRQAPTIIAFGYMSFADKKLEKMVL